MYFNPGLQSKWTLWRVDKGAQGEEIGEIEKRITNIVVTAFPCFREHLYSDARPIFERKAKLKGKDNKVIKRTD